MTDRCAHGACPREPETIIGDAWYCRPHASLAVHLGRGAAPAFVSVADREAAAEPPPTPKPPTPRAVARVSTVDSAPRSHHKGGTKGERRRPVSIAVASTAAPGVCLCTLDGAPCTRPVYARGACSACLSMLRKRGRVDELPPALPRDVRIAQALEKWKEGFRAGRNRMPPPRVAKLRPAALAYLATPEAQGLSIPAQAAASGISEGTIAWARCELRRRARETSVQPDKREQ